MKKTLLLLAVLMSFGQMIAQRESVWLKMDTQELTSLTRERQNINSEGELYFSLDLNSFRQQFLNAPDKTSSLPGNIIEIPNLNGVIERFQVWENSNMTADYQAKFPEIRAYAGKGIDDKLATINLSVSPYGIQTMVFRANSGEEFIEGYNRPVTAYVLFGSKNRNPKTLNCTTINTPINIDENNGENTNRSDNAKFKEFRLALSCTAEYANYFGATSSAQQALVVTAMNNTMTRVNGVYEKDLSVHLNMVDNSNVIFYNTSTDPYSAASGMSSWNSQLQTTLSNTTYMGDANYDIGHLFGASGGGGNAGCIGCVCVDGQKGSGITSPGSGGPLGDNFDIDYVAHEMGHQLGGNHSFTFGYEGSTAQVEPGSGSTIMGYAGITSYDVQAHSDPIFCYKNIAQIQSNLNSGTHSCYTLTSLGGINATPAVTLDGTSFTIPISTPFVLNATATDADANDVLTYLWEQNDVGSSTTADASSRVIATKTAGPIFRTFKPSTNTFRYFPEMGRIMAGVIVRTTGSNSYWETCSSIARTLHFTFTARDNHPGMGQTKTSQTNVIVNATGGPFTVTSQATTGLSFAGLSTQTVTWNVANTTAAPFNTANVDILISTNASTALETFNATSPTSPNPTTWTTIASGVPNNGSYDVTLPNVATSTATCRFMVKAVGNVYFAINSKNFTITPNLANEQFGLDNFSLFPNPNNGSFNIKFDSSTSNEIQVNVYDIRGREVYANSFKNTGLFDQNVSIGNVQKGVYLVNVKDGDRKVVRKVVIE